MSPSLPRRCEDCQWGRERVRESWLGQQRLDSPSGVAVRKKGSSCGKKSDVTPCKLEYEQELGNEGFGKVVVWGNWMRRQRENIGRKGKIKRERESGGKEKWRVKEKETGRETWKSADKRNGGGNGQNEIWKCLGAYVLLGPGSWDLAILTAAL